jgi:formamidopyrimidine-DNA glycosylase
MRRGLLPVVGYRIAGCSLPPCKLRPILISPKFPLLKKRLLNQKIVEIGRRGKRLLLHLSDESVVVIEPRMTGLLLLEDPPGPEHLRLCLDLEHVHLENERSPSIGRKLLFWDRRGLGTVRWLAKAEIDQVLGPEKLGPDALVITLAELKSRLKPSRRAIKVAMLDQKAVAGIGNLYASEILFLAGVDPRTSCDRLSGPQWQGIHGAIGEVLNEAILHEGSTLSDGTYRNALNQAGNYQNHHRVYDYAGAVCKRCHGAEIERIVQAQRCTFFCPRCQTKRKKSRGRTDAILTSDNLTR